MVKASAAPVVTPMTIRLVSLVDMCRSPRSAPHPGLFRRRSNRGPDYELNWKPLDRGIERPSLSQRNDSFDASPAEVLDWLTDCCKRGAKEVERFHIVEGDDRDVIRNFEMGLANDLKAPHGDLVTGRKHRHGTIRLRKKLSHGSSAMIDRIRSEDLQRDVGANPSLAQRLSITALSLKGARDPFWSADEGNATVSKGYQVLGREIAAMLIVAEDLGNSRTGHVLIKNDNVTDLVDGGRQGPIV